MAKRRKLWSELAQSTRDRYSKAGVTARQYNSGNIPASAKAKATGRKPSPPRQPSGHIVIEKARGKVKPFTQLSKSRQESDIRKVMAVTGMSRKDARRKLINASNRGRILKSSKMIGPVPKESAVADIAGMRAKEFLKLSPDERSKLAEQWADERRGRTPRYSEDDLPDWPYPDELDAEGWKRYQEAVS